MAVQTDYKKLVIISFIGLLLTSCGSSTDDSSNKKNRVKAKQTFSTNPLAYENDYISCEGEDEFSTFLNLHAFYEDQIIINESTTLNNSYQAYPVIKSLSSNFLVNTNYGKEFNTVYKIKVNEEGQVLGVRQKDSEKSGGSLKICPENKLKRDSLQHIAANVITTLDKSYQSLQVIGEHLEIKPITVYTHPIVSETYHFVRNYGDKPLKSETQVMTDNAFYFQNGLYFIPHSKELKTFLGDKHVDYWELPFVASHEYGHHIFASFFPKSQKSYSNLSMSKIHKCFHGHTDLLKEFESIQNEKTDETRYVTKNEVLSSFNEGFADLFAFYTLDKASASLETIVGFDDEREVDSILFANFTPKIFSNTVGRAFFDDTTYSNSNSLSTFQSSHTIGAIYAAQFNLLMDKYNLDSSRKLKVSLNWLKRMNKEIDSHKYTYSIAYMKAGILDFLIVLNEELGQELDYEQIEFLTKAFPYFEFEDISVSIEAS